MTKLQPSKGRNLCLCKANECGRTEPGIGHPGKPCGNWNLPGSPYCITCGVGIANKSGEIKKEWFDTYAAAKERMLELQKSGHLVRLERADGQRGSKFLGNVYVEYLYLPQTKGNPPSGVSASPEARLIYEVLVGNLGVVYGGDSKPFAVSVFEEYVKASKYCIGRSCGEDVTLFEEGEPIREYKGTLDNPRKAHRGASKKAKYRPGQKAASDFSDENWRTMLGEAQALGEAAGANAAEWTIQDAWGGRAGRDAKAVAQNFLKKFAEGDPEVMDTYVPPNLSGEYADDMTPAKLYVALGLEFDFYDDTHEGELENAWETGANTSFYNTLEESANSFLKNENSSSGLHKNKRACPLCAFSDYPSAVVNHLMRVHCKTLEEARDLVIAPEDNEYDNPPRRGALTTVGKKCTLIRTDEMDYQENMGRILGTEDGSLIIEGDFTGKKRLLGTIQTIEAIEYKDDAKARKEGLKADGRPWRHDFTKQGLTVLRIRGGILIVGDKRLWDYR